MAEEDGEVKPPRNLGKLIAVIGIVANLAGLGGGLWMVYSGTIGYEAPMAREQELAAELEAFTRSLQQQPVIFHLGILTTNLDGLPRRLIKVDVSLEMLDSEGFEEVMLKSAESHDSLLRLLNARQLTELESVQGKLQLKSDIIARVNQVLHRGVVKNVYFTEFVVQ